MTWRGLMITGALILLSFSSGIAHAEDRPFGLWLEDVRHEAAQQGIPAAVIDDALGTLEPDPTVVRLDHKQPENTVSFGDYSAGVVSDTRVEKGRELMEEYHDLLQEIGKRYGVEPRYIVALWGIESQFGTLKGNYTLVRSLATLAYEGRRAEFFRTELFNSLRISTQENILPAALTGSWAGAMGQCQFMPSTYLKYAVDWDRDGHRDIWNSVPDSLASIANYLHELGWNGRVSWGRAIEVPSDFRVEEANINVPRTLSEWSKRGVTLADGTPLSDSGQQAYVVFPGDPSEGAYLVTENYQALLHWNRSRFFATSVGLLADRLGDE